MTRKEIIQNLEDILNEDKFDPVSTKGIETIIFVINTLKQRKNKEEEEQPTRIRAMWERGKMCSNCKFIPYYYHDCNESGYNFCPNCGADMRKDPDDDDEA